jgi:predicted double-glycine peptidase
VNFYSFADPHEPSDINNVSASLMPAIAAFLDDARKKFELTGIDHLGVYNDRPTRQNEKVVSAHAFGQAIDISGFRFKDGSEIKVADHDNPDVLLKLNKMEACLSRHFLVVVDWRDDPKWHQTHFHCEVRGPRPRGSKPAVSANFESVNKLEKISRSGARLYRCYQLWLSADCIRQAHPSSCGSAGLATILKYGFGKDVTEDDVMKAVGTDGNSGVTFSDLTRGAKQLGFSAENKSLTIDELRDELDVSDIPVEVAVDLGGSGHFDDVMGVLGDDVLIADPNFGCRAMTDEQFAQIWHGDALIVQSEKMKRVRKGAEK